MSGITFLLPVVQIKMAKELLVALDKNTIKPTRVIVMDDSDYGFDPIPSTEYPVAYIRTKERGQTNEIFNTGMRMYHEDEFVVMGNDDVVIHDRLLETIILAFDDNKRFGAVCPVTVGSLEEVGVDEKPRYSAARGREGSIVAYRTSVFSQIPPVPKEIKVFFADDWCWNYVIDLGYLWGRIESSRIYHYLSISTQERGLFKFMADDKRVFQKLTGGRVKMSRSYMKELNCPGGIPRVRFS
jgi:hypothetical protein